MEYFDVLDENGNKTGKTKERKAVHKDGDWHKAVHIWIINDKCELLLQKRSLNKDSSPNMWDISSAGHLSAGEDSVTGAIRELKEELNIDINGGELEFLATIQKPGGHKKDRINNEFDDVYLLPLNIDIEDIRIQEKEISEVKFVHYKRLEEMVQNKEKDLLIHQEEFDLLFKIVRERYM